MCYVGKKEKERDVGNTNVSWSKTVSLHISGACSPLACVEWPDGEKSTDKVKHVYRG